MRTTPFPSPAGGSPRASFPLIAYIFLVIGLVVLVLAGDLLVRGSVAIALKLGIPTLVIGLTIVAFGTSAPELVISLSAALSGAPGIALGNVVGSNIANILLVLGLPSIIYATRCDQHLLLRNTVFMLIGTVAFIALAFTTPLHVWQGTILVALMIAFLWASAARARFDMNAAAFADVSASASPDTGSAQSSSHEGEPVESGAPEGDVPSNPGPEPDVPTPPSGRMLISVVMVIAGLIGLPLGAHLAVTGAREIALEWGMSDAAVGLTVVAVGTSLPELAATTMAALRRESAIAVGNVIGSNIFNLLAIMGITALAAPVPVSPTVLHVDIWVMFAASLAIVPFVYWRLRIGKLAGLAFLLIYFAYVAMVVGERSVS